MSPAQYAKLLAEIIRRRHCPESFARGVELRMMQAGQHDAAHRIRVARMVAFHWPPGKRT